MSGKATFLNARITMGVSGKLVVTFVEECSETLNMNFRYTRCI